MDANKIKIGNKILMEGQPCEVVEVMRRQQPRLAAKIITKFKNLLTGATVEKTFTSGENVIEADITKISAQYIYNDGSGNYIFMDNSSSEQFELPKDKLKNAVNFLIEGMDVEILKFGDTPIDIELPLSMTLTVESTEPAIKGDSVTNTMKPATLETGYEIQVPLFINSGEKIIINTETGEYKGRAK